MNIELTSLAYLTDEELAELRTTFLDMRDAWTRKAQPRLVSLCAVLADLLLWETARRRRPDQVQEVPVVDLEAVSEMSNLELEVIGGHALERRNALARKQPAVADFWNDLARCFADARDTDALALLREPVEPASQTED